MTFPDTRPYCGQCGWAPDNSGLGDIDADLICDSCGADLSLYGFTSGPPPLPTGYFVAADSSGALNNITTPVTADIQLVSDFEMEVDLGLVDWAAFAGGDNALTVGGGADGYQLEFGSFGAITGRIWVAASQRNKAGPATGLAPNVRAKIRYSLAIASYDMVFYQDDVEVGTGTMGGTPTESQDAATVAAHLFGLDGTDAVVGSLWGAKVMDGIGGTEVLVFNATDAQFPAGAVADGETFVSNGRIWTVNGDFWSYAYGETSP